MLSRPLEAVHASVKGSILDPLRVAKEVECYRNYWKPNRVTTVLLAESHVHTSTRDFGRTWRYKKLGGHFVRYVYCLGYGENDLFRMPIKPPAKNEQGTRPFWEIFYGCLHHVKSNDDFERLLQSKTNWKGRVEEKIKLLENLREHEIWLVDASPVAINMLKSEVKIGIMRKAWELYTGKLVEDLANDSLKRVGIIGKTVNEAVGMQVKRLPLRVECFLQPGYASKRQRRKSFPRYYKLCH